MRYSGTTHATVPEILQRARATFGPSGAGLRLASTDLTSATYAHASGHVTVAIQPGFGENVVVVETREFDADAVRFIAALPRLGPLTQIARRFRRSKT